MIRSARNWRRGGCSIFLFVAATAFFFCPSAQAQPGVSSVPADGRARFVRRVFEDDQGKHRYAVYLPHGYDARRPWPSLVYLHGASKRGTDGVKHTTDGLARVLKTWRSPQPFPFVVVFPQCEDTRGRILIGWSAGRPDGERVISILDAAAKEFNLDRKRVILTGWSMGAYGTWSLGDAHPDRFAGIVPLSGGGDLQDVDGLKNLPIWAVHGAQDKIVLPSESGKMVETVEKAGGQVRFSLVEETGHDITRAVYSNPRVIAWMLKPVRDSEEKNLPRVHYDRKSKPGAAGSPEEDQDPFIPALEVSRAVTIRLGNNALKAAAESAPKLIPAEMVRGSIPDIYDTTEASGRTFNIQFSGITYSGTVERVHFKAYQKDRLNLQFALRNLVMTIGASYIDGRGRSAAAGPIHVVMGHRRPLWLSIDVNPTVKDRKMRFQLLATGFEIPDDNWYVTQPAGVEAHGLFMTREKVSSGLVSGIYGRKAQIEQQILGFVPQMITRMEEQLELASASKVVEALWPLPVYRPQVRVFPEHASVDAKGVSLVLGIIVGAPEPDKAPAKVRKVSMSSRLPVIPESTDLVLGVATNLIQHMTEEIITSNVAHIHVLDIPRGTFSEFSDRKTLESIFPQLKNLPANVQVNSELVLVQPLSLQSEGSTGKPGAGQAGRKDPENPNDKPAKEASNGEAVPLPGEKSQTYLRLTAPKLRIRVTTYTDIRQNNWTPYADLDFDLSQRVRIELAKPSFTHRTLRAALTEDPEIRAAVTFAPDVARTGAKADLPAARKLFLEGWKKWTGRGLANIVNVTDLDMGFAKLRLDQVGFANDYLNVALEPPGIRITNASKEPLKYEIQAPHARWSDPITLPPGEFHDFDISTPLLFRREDKGEYKTFTLPAGSHSRFRVPKSGGAPRLFLVTE